VTPTETFVRAAAALQNFAIPEENLPAVLAAFEVITAQARLVTDFPLPETTEAAQHFTP